MLLTANRNGTYPERGDVVVGEEGVESSIELQPATFFSLKCVTQALHVVVLLLLFSLSGLFTRLSIIQ